MADVWTIVAGASGPALLAGIKLYEKIAARRHASEQGEVARVTEAHDECRREVAEVRTKGERLAAEIVGLRVSVAACESKHAAAEAKVNALDTLVQYLVRQSRTHDTDPPPGMEPAE